MIAVDYQILCIYSLPCSKTLDFIDKFIYFSFCRIMADTRTQIPAPQTEEQQQSAHQQPDDRAKDKGKQIMVEPEDIDVMNFKPEDFGKPLDLKVYRKWVSKNIPDLSPTGMCFILLDKKVHVK